MKKHFFQKLFKLASLLLFLHLLILLVLVFSLSYPNPFKAFYRTPPPEIPFLQEIANETPLWFFSKPACPAVFLIAHGRSHDKSYMRPLIERVWKESNLCILAIDLPSHGERSYGTTTIGPREKSAISDAFVWMKQKKHHNVILYGVSMGGSAIIHALQTPPKDIYIQGYITDGTYSELSSLVEHVAESIHMPTYIQILGIDIVNWWVGYTIQTVRPKDITPALPYPYLALHGSFDHLAPIFSAQELTKKNHNALFYHYNGGHDQPENKHMQDCVLSFFESLQQTKEPWQHSLSCSNDNNH